MRSGRCSRPARRCCTESAKGLVAVDDEGRIVLMNDAAARLLDIPDPAAVLGSEVDTVLDRELARFIASGEDRETPVLSGERVLLVHGDRVRVEGREVGSIAILRDRTELETMLRDLEGAQGLAEGLRAQSHEFSNKLHVVSGLLELGHVDAAIAFIERVGSGGALSPLDEHDGHRGCRDGGARARETIQRPGTRPRPRTRPRLAFRRRRRRGAPHRPAHGRSATCSTMRSRPACSADGSSSRSATTRNPASSSCAWTTTAPASPVGAARRSSSPT